MKISELAREAALNTIRDQWQWPANGTRVERLAEAYQSAINTACQPLVEALEEISKGYGAYNPDPFEHAKNCIEDAKQLARAALKAHHREHGQEAPVLEKPVLPVTKAEVAAWKRETK